MHDILKNCPVCGGRLFATSLKCLNCKSTFQGRFSLNEFTTLSQDALNFLRVYLKNRGNLSKVAEIMNISYPTAHAWFSNVLKQLGYLQPSEQVGETFYVNVADVLEDLENGDINFQEALNVLKTGKKRRDSS